MPPRKKQAITAAVNVIGPDGTLCPAGEPIPSDWLADPEFDVEALIASGGATHKKG